MREIDTEEMKQLQLSLLEQFDKYCGENNLKYFLVGGTALGAIRHHGFIPWDDDIDVAMTRPQYEIFINNYNMKGARLLTSNNTVDYYHPFAKLTDPRTLISEKSNVDSKIGVYIDIFPIDGVSNNTVLKKICFIKRTWYELIMTSKTAQTDIPRSRPKKVMLSLIKIIFSRVKLTDVIKRIEKVAQKCSFYDAKMAGCIVWGYGIREVMPKHIYENYITVTFEGQSFWILREYDKYLHSVYGDYMTLPPIEKRIYKHGVRAYWL